MKATMQFAGMVWINVPLLYLDVGPCAIVTLFAAELYAQVSGSIRWPRGPHRPFGRIGRVLRGGYPDGPYRSNAGCLQHQGEGAFHQPGLLFIYIICHSNDLMVLIMVISIITTICDLHLRVASFYNSSAMPVGKVFWPSRASASFPGAKRGLCRSGSSRTCLKSRRRRRSRTHLRWVTSLVLGS